jgi:hypothetical protein
LALNAKNKIKPCVKLKWYSYNFVSISFVLAGARPIRSETLVNEVSELVSLFETRFPRGSSLLKQLLLVQFKIWEFTRNLHFTVI